MKILLASDLSAASETVVGKIAASPWPNGSSLCLLNVVDLFTFRSSPANSRLIAAQVRNAESPLRAAAEKLSSRGPSVVTAVTKGYPPTTILDYAREWNAGLIIIGSRTTAESNDPARQHFEMLMIGDRWNGIGDSQQVSLEKGEAKWHVNQPVSLLWRLHLRSCSFHFRNPARRRLKEARIMREGANFTSNTVPVVTARMEKVTGRSRQI
jgi:nucleotide-binding universal stress UspA family protein